MANEPRHVAQQAVSKQDRKHMQQTNDDRRAAATERAEDQFGKPQDKVSPDVYPAYSGDTALTSRDEVDNKTPAGENARTMATNADDHKEKVSKEGLTPTAKDSVKGASTAK
jgi:hypothetical protein